MGCSPSILSSLSNNGNNRKDSGLYCNSETNSNNKIDSHDDSNTSKALANQILVQSVGKDVMEKVKLPQTALTRTFFNYYKRRSLM